MASVPRDFVPPAQDGGYGYVGLLDTLDYEIASCGGHDSRMALIIIDLSGIDVLIPTLGYRKITTILDYVQEKLLDIKRPTDKFTRISIRHFALIITDLKFQSMVDLLANKIVSTLDGLRYFTGMNTTIYPRVGVAYFPEHGHTAEELLLGADIASQSVCGSSNLLVHAGSVGQTRNKQTREIEAVLEDAFKQTQFEMHYQPKIELGSGLLYGAEALLRWNHQDYGMISPAFMIPIIEKSILLEEITLWALNTSLRHAKQIREHSPGFRVAVNLSPALLASPDLVDLVSQSLRIWNTAPEMLILEVTETTIMVNQEVSQKNLHRLSKLGVMLSIDDFGTGYSSYSYLQQLPVQELKIDKSFIDTLLLDNNNALLVQSMIGLGQDLGINVLAEGIETREVNDRLIEMGCAYGQGFLFAKPLSIDEFMEWADKHGKGDKRSGTGGTELR